MVFGNWQEKSIFICLLVGNDGVGQLKGVDFINSTSVLWTKLCSRPIYI